MSHMHGPYICTRSYSGHTIIAVHTVHTAAPRNVRVCVCTCSSIWMVPACSSSSSSWSLTFASRSRSCFLTLASEASSFDSCEFRSCSSASICSSFRLRAHISRSLSWVQEKETVSLQHSLLGAWLFYQVYIIIIKRKVSLLGTPQDKHSDQCQCNSASYVIVYLSRE